MNVVLSWEVLIEADVDILGYLKQLQGERRARPRTCVLHVMGVFPLLEDFRGPRDNAEFMRGMSRRVSALSPDFITSCAEFPDV